MYDMEITMLEYVLINLNGKQSDNEYQVTPEYIVFLFASQGIENISYLNFEAEFPELCHNLPSLIEALKTPEFREKIGYCLRRKYYLDMQERKKPKKVLSDEFDKDDYEASQNLSQIPFHI